MQSIAFPPDSSPGNTQRNTIPLLTVDPDLAEVIRPDQREAATAEIIAPGGAYQPGPIGWSNTADGFAVLVVDGFLLRVARLQGRSSAQLLGPGDVTAPDGMDTDLDAELAWYALTPVTLALLETRWLASAARWPSVAAALIRRANATADRLAAQRAASQQLTVEERLKGLFALFCERWGRRNAQGTYIDIPLRHHQLAELASAARPPVSTAIASLRNRGVLLREGDRWLIPDDVARG